MKNRTVRSIVLNYVEANGPQTWTELHKVVLTVAGKNVSDPKNNHWGIGYLDFCSSGSLLFPTKKDSRYLVLSHVDEKYHLINE